MNKHSEPVILWRQRTKIKLVNACGGKCRRCGYNKCIQALEFHHKDPTLKKFAFGKYQSKSIQLVVEEIKKCLLLCANCHREYHAGLFTTESMEIIFDDTQIVDSYIRTKILHPCYVCGRETSNIKFCSSTCSHQHQQKIDWSKFDLVEMYKTLNYVEISKVVGVSDTTIKKKLNARRASVVIALD